MAPLSLSLSYSQKQKVRCFLSMNETAWLCCTSPYIFFKIGEKDTADLNTLQESPPLTDQPTSSIPVIQAMGLLNWSSRFKIKQIEYIVYNRSREPQDLQASVSGFWDSPWVTPPPQGTILLTISHPSPTLLCTLICCCLAVCPWTTKIMIMHGGRDLCVFVESSDFSTCINLPTFASSPGLPLVRFL